MRGILISATMQDVFSIRDEARKSAADGNVCALNPSDFICASVASRTDSSSSTIEIIGLGL
jgi:hypothetical protein